MTLEEQLTEAEDIKELVVTGLKNNVSSGSLLGYTTNGTKVVYEGATATYKLKRELEKEISHIQSLIMNNKRLNYV